MNYQVLRPAEIVAISPHPVLRAKKRAREVLGWLAVYVGQNTSLECWPSVAELVEESGLSRGTIFQALADLEEAGLIVDTGRKAGRRSQIVVRKLVLEPLMPVRDSRTGPGLPDPKGSTRPGDGIVPVRETASYPSGRLPLTRPGLPDTDPSKDPSMGSPHRNNPPQPPAGGPVDGEGSSGGVPPAVTKLVNRYLKDTRGEQTLGKAARAKLEQDIATRLGEGLTPAQVWRAWELLRDEPGWRKPPRLGWLVEDPSRIEARLEREDEDDDDDEEPEITVESAQRVAVSIAEEGPPAWWLRQQAALAANGGEAK